MTLNSVRRRLVACALCVALKGYNMKVKVRPKPPPLIEAEQFLVNEKPWPSGVHKVPDYGFCIRINSALSHRIFTGDWIVQLEGKTDIMSDTDFREFYEIVEEQK